MARHYIEREDLCEIAAAIENGRPMDEPFISRIYKIIEEIRPGDTIELADTPGLDIQRR